MFHYRIHVGIGLSELIMLRSIDNVPILYLNKYSLNYLPSLDIDMMYIDNVVYIDMNQMLISFE